MSPAPIDISALRRKAISARSHATAAVDELGGAAAERSRSLTLARCRTAKALLESTADAARAALEDLGPVIDQLSIRDDAEGDV